MGQYEKDKKELQEKIDQLEHKLKKAKQSGDKADVDKYSRKLADRRAKLAALGQDPIPVTATVVAPAAPPIPVSATVVAPAPAPAPIPVSAAVVKPPTKVTTTPCRRSPNSRRRSASTCGTASSASPTASCRTATRTSAGRRVSRATARTASTGRPWAA